MAFDTGPRGADGTIADMNVVPLIDVMLVLLILCIVTIPIQTHAVKLDMPQPRPDSDEAVPPAIVDLRIDFDGTVLWNGNAVANRATLQTYFETIAAQASQPQIHLRADRLARYESVASVLSDAQRLGVEKIGFVGTGEYAQ